MNAHVRSSLMQAVQRMNGSPVAVRESDTNFLLNIQSVFQMSADEDDFDLDAEERIATERNRNLCAAYGMAPSSGNKPFAFSGGFAIIPIHGSLINRYGGYYYGYVTGYNFIRSQMNAALADPDVDAIIFDVNSNGGEAAGCFELANEIFASRAVKPSFAVVDSNAYSAAYALGSAATKMAVIPSGGAGSIGVISMHVDISKMLEDFGVKVSIIKSGAHKADGNPFESLSDETKARWQADVDTMREDFVNLVAQNRNLDPKVVRDTEALCYNAPEALALGLIDAVTTPAKAVAEFLNGPSGGSDEQPGANAMFTQEQMDAARQEAADEATATATAAATTAERTRISGILGCKAAEGRSKLASHIAFNTAMSVADAETMLGASAVEQAPAPAAATNQPEKGADSPFKTVMDNADHPNMGAENENQEEPGKADGLMAAMAAVAGDSFTK